MLFRSLAAERDIELQSSTPDSELIIDADYNRIMQVLTNLVSNAIETCSAGGHISVRVKDVSSEIAVEVQDDGPSIKSSETEIIFNRFARIEKQLHHGKEQKLALGLPIAKELVEMHGGCIWVESEDGQGNNFYFTLPKAGIQKKQLLRR